MGSQQPRVSIGVAIYNEERFLRPALDSLLAQDFADFELIISDNASTDGTQAIGMEFAARDPRVRYHRNEVNVGATENFNVVFRLSCAEYFMWAGGHDVWAPTYVSRCIEVLESDPAIVQCNSEVQYMSQDGTEFGQTMHQMDTRRRGLLTRAYLMMWHASTFHIYSVFRSSVLRQTRMLRRVLGPDLLLGFELSLLGPAAIIPEPLQFMRDNRGEGSRQFKVTQATAELQRRLYPQGMSAIGRFGLAKYLVEEMRAVQLAPISWWQRIVLMASIPPSYFLKFYRYLPQGFRSAFRRLVDRCFSSPQHQTASEGR